MSLTSSMFRSTNETMNVWTHFLGALLFIFLIYLTYAIPIENMDTMRQEVAKANALVQCNPSSDFTSTLFDEAQSKAACIERLSHHINAVEDFSSLYNYIASRKSVNVWKTMATYLMNIVTMTKGETHQEQVAHWPIMVFIACAIWCMSASYIFHQYYCLSFTANNVLQTLDYCGICILISGSYVPVIYYSFYCYPTYMKMHLIIVIILNVLNVCVMATPKFRSPAYRSVRARSFTIVACYAVIAIVHLLILDGLKNPMFTVLFWYMIGMGGTYILGAVLYGTRFPEKFWPGHFDYVVRICFLYSFIVCFSSTIPCVYCHCCSFPLCRMLSTFRGSS